MTAAEVARKLKMSPPRLHYWIKKGFLPKVGDSARGPVYSDASIEMYRERRRAALEKKLGAAQK